MIMNLHLPFSPRFTRDADRYSGSEISRREEALPFCIYLFIYLIFSTSLLASAPNSSEANKNRYK